MIDTIEEVWVQIPGFWKYSVSNYGHVWDNYKEDYVDTIKDHQGHLKVTLYQNSSYYSVYIYILVARTFLPEYNPKFKTKHRDGDRTNNRVENLYQDAPNHALNEDIMKELAGEVVISPDRGARKVVVVDTKEVFASAEDLANHLGVSLGYIYKVIDKPGKTCRGLTLSYLRY